MDGCCQWPLIVFFLMCTMWGRPPLREASEAKLVALRTVLSGLRHWNRDVGFEADAAALPRVRIAARLPRDYPCVGFFF